MTTIEQECYNSISHDVTASPDLQSKPCVTSKRHNGALYDVIIGREGAWCVYVYLGARLRS